MKPPEILRTLNSAFDASGLTLYDLSAKTGYPVPSLSRWMSGTREIKLEQLVRVAAALGCEIEIRTAATAKARRATKRRRG